MKSLIGLWVVIDMESKIKKTYGYHKGFIFGSTYSVVGFCSPIYSVVSIA